MLVPLQLIPTCATFCLKSRQLLYDLGEGMAIKKDGKWKDSVYNPKEFRTHFSKKAADFEKTAPRVFRTESSMESAFTKVIGVAVLITLLTVFW